MSMKNSHALKMFAATFLLALNAGQALQAQAPKDEQLATVASSREDDEKKYASRNAENLKSSRSVKEMKNNDIVTMDSDYNHIIMSGQSLSVGADSEVTLSTEQKHGNVMIGDDVSFWIQNDNGKFFPLIGKQGRGGENPVFGTANFFKKLYEDSKGPERMIIASSCGTSGKSIEQLSKDGPNCVLDEKAQIAAKKWCLWSKMPGAVRAGKEITAKLGKSYSVIAVCWVQGETNYSPNGADWATTKDDYKKKLAEYRQNFIKDAANDIAGQKMPPAFITYQTGGSYSNDINGLAIGMAQWELTNEVPGCYMATPKYPFVSYGGHLTANGYRWMGAQFAKVLDKVLLKRQGWKPLSPRNLSLEGRTISIDFHVPEPPLVFDGTYIGRKKMDSGNKGFAVLDIDGEVPVKSVRIVMGTIVEIVCARDFHKGSVYVKYAGKTPFDGNGNLRDSDTAVSEDLYVYDPDAKNLPDENIPELVGKPYPLYNWSIAFYLKAR